MSRVAAVFVWRRNHPEISALSAGFCVVRVLITTTAHRSPAPEAKSKLRVLSSHLKGIPSSSKPRRRDSFVAVRAATRETLHPVDPQPTVIIVAASTMFLTTPKCTSRSTTSTIRGEPQSAPRRTSCRTMEQRSQSLAVVAPSGQTPTSCSSLRHRGELEAVQLLTAESQTRALVLPTDRAPEHVQ